jgi:hypothetical protein
MVDEMCKMPCDLRIGRPVIGQRRGDSLRLAEFVDLDDPWRDGATGRLPDQTASKDHGKEQIAESDEPPVASLKTSRADTLVPGLTSLLIRRLRLWRPTVADRRATEHRYRASPINA